MLNFPNKKARKFFSPFPEQNAFVAFLNGKTTANNLEKAVSSMVFIFCQYVVTNLID